MGTTNQNLLVEEGEKILKELRDRDFTVVNATATEEYNLAVTGLQNARQMLNQTLDLYKQAQEANKTLEMLRKKIRQTLETTLKTLDGISISEKLNDKSMSYDSEVRPNSLTHVDGNDKVRLKLQSITISTVHYYHSHAT